jgi:hypothetical protein
MKTKENQRILESKQDKRTTEAINDGKYQNLQKNSEKY